MGMFDFLDANVREKKQLEKEIANYKEQKNSLLLQLSSYVSKIRNLEAQIKVLRPAYESAHGAEKNIIAAKIKPLLQDLELVKEKESLLSQHIKDLTSLIHNKELQILNASTPALIDDIEVATEDRIELSRDLRDQQKAGDKLRDQVLCGDDSELIFPEESSQDDLLGEKMDLLLGIEKNKDLDGFSKN